MTRFMKRQNCRGGCREQDSRLDGVSIAIFNTSGFATDVSSSSTLFSSFLLSAFSGVYPYHCYQYHHWSW